MLLGRLLWERKTYTKMDQIRFFIRDQKFDQADSYGNEQLIRKLLLLLLFLTFSALVANPLLSATFSISFLPYPRSCLVFCSRDVGSAVPPTSPRPSSVSGADLVLTHRLFSFLTLSAAVLYCTVVYCTVRQF